MKEYALQEAELSEMVQDLYSNDQTDQLNAIKKFRHCSNIDGKPLISAIIDNGVVPRFVELLQMIGNSTLQLNAAWTLENIASGTSEHTKTVVDAGAVPILIELLNYEFRELQYHAVWTLGNIAGDCPEYRDLVLANGVMDPIIRILNKLEEPSAVRIVSWALSNFCRGKDPRPDFEKVSPCLPVLSKLLHHADNDVLRVSCWALAYLSDGTNDRIQVIIDSGVCERLVELLKHSSRRVVCAALRAVGNIVTGDDDQTQVIINNSAALPRLLQLLYSPRQAIRKDCCWTISNITAGNRDQIQAVIEANIVPTLIDIVEHGDFRTKKEAAWAITNATSGGSPEQIRYLVEQNCILHLCNLLSFTDSKIILVALNGLENILLQGDHDTKASDGTNQYAAIVKGCSGIDKIKYLQICDDIEIRQKVVGIIIKYFDPDDRTAIIAQLFEDSPQVHFVAEEADESMGG